MIKEDDQTSPPERKVTFRLDDDEAPTLTARGIGGTHTFRARRVHVHIVGLEPRLHAVYVSGPRITPTGKEHATATDAWSWRENKKPWPPSDAPDCARAAVAEVSRTETDASGIEISNAITEKVKDWLVVSEDGAPAALAMIQALRHAVGAQFPGATGIDWSNLFNFGFTLCEKCAHPEHPPGECLGLIQCPTCMDTDMCGCGQ